MIVADASLLANLHLPQPGSGVADAVLAKEPAWWAPSLWRFEMHSALLKHLGQGSVDLAGCLTIMFAATTQLGSNVRNVSSIAVLQEAFELGISTYDAEYIALARQMNSPLVTFDQKLVRAAKGLAVLAAEFAR